LFQELRITGQEILRKPRKLPWIVVHAFSQARLGKRGSPVGEQLQPKLGLSLVKTQRPQRSERMVKIIGENILSFPSELSALAPWREEFPNPRTFDVRKIQAARYDKHVGRYFRIALQ
jgi:hypothetical protein